MTRTASLATHPLPSRRTSRAPWTADLAGTGVTCPRFEDYADRLLDFMLEHPEYDSAAMA